MKFNLAKHFNLALFQNFTNHLKEAASVEPRTFSSRMLNIGINYYSQYLINKDIKRRSFTFEGVEIANFINKIQDVEIVSFDIFDTLLIRKVEKPEDIFALMEVELEAIGFSAARKYAEKRCRLSLNKEDVSLEDIYKFIPIRYRSLIRMEREYEQRMLERNPLVYELYLTSLRQGKRIIAVSDMYLDSHFLESVLKREGYTKIDKIFVSNEIGGTKWTGKIFPKVEENLGVNSEAILHVGDNYQSDILKAKASNWKVFRVPQIHARIKSTRKKYSAISEGLSSSIHNSLVCRYKGCGNIWHEYGYMLGGPLVLSFLFWIIRRAEMTGTDHLAFVGRDGWVLKEIYDKYLKRRDISSSYVYLPRIISLAATLHYNGCPSYLEYILQKAASEGVDVSASKTFKVNLETFNKHFEELLQWAQPRRQELTRHLNERLGTARAPAFVDLTGLWLTSFSAAREIVGCRNNNNFVLWFFW